MNQFEIAKSIILKIQNDEIPFAVALRSAFHKRNVDQITRNNITALVGCELRHRYISDNLLSRFFDDADFEKTIYLRFALENHLFLKLQLKKLKRKNCQK